MKSNTIRKIMLTVPNGLWFRNRTFKLIPYNLALLQAVIPREYEVCILDPNLENLSIEQVGEKINAFRPDMVGITASSLEFSKSVHKMAELTKTISPTTLVILGGAYATVTPEFPMEDTNIDFAILGEGEERFPMLLEMLKKGDKDFTKFDGLAYRKNSKVIINSMKSFIENLDKLPFPAYDKFNYRTYANRPDKYANTLLPKYYPYAVTSTSRGCPFDCIYCHTWAKDGKKTRFKSAERVLEEIDWLVNDYGTKELIFLDDNFNLNRPRFVKILKGLIKKNYNLHWKSINITAFLLDEELLELMKASKLYQLILPIESGNQYVLDKILRKPLKLEKMLAIIKKAKELDFEIAADFIIGIPGETWDQIRDTTRFADVIDVDLVLFHIATPIPKTELYDIAKRNNYLGKDFDFRSHKFFGFGRGYITTDEFSPYDLHRLRAFEWDRINFKTQRKKERYAMMAGISLEELDKWRKETIKNAGLYFPEHTHVA
ncbi:MAG: radical SAM protein [Candidatus Omnitrophota bacterium]|nr:MAG: radical SAM protein [Candidatus Omnitrophota bacterium]